MESSEKGENNIEILLRGHRERTRLTMFSIVAKLLSTNPGYLIECYRSTLNPFYDRQIGDIKPSEDGRFASIQLEDGIQSYQDLVSDPYFDNFGRAWQQSHYWLVYLSTQDRFADFVQKAVFEKRRNIRIWTNDIGIADLARDSHDKGNLPILAMRGYPLGVKDGVPTTWHEIDNHSIPYKLARELVTHPINIGYEIIKLSWKGAVGFYRFIDGSVPQM
ncbi:MAG: hypothetical protein V1740_02055 [Candidatus Woesearchaeota archaeon]